MPADDPDLAVLSGHGLRLRLLRGDDGAPARLRLTCDDPGAGRLVAPNGTAIELAEAVRPLAVPALAPVFELTRASPGDPAVAVERGCTTATSCRAARVEGSSPPTSPSPTAVPCPTTSITTTSASRSSTATAGWVRVVYEDQGPPFVVEAGDCVLQPPGIRHRVLESSAGLEVVEVTCPAAHPTHADHDMTLPTPAVAPRARLRRPAVRAPSASRCDVGAVAVRHCRPGDTAHRRRRPTASPVSASCGRRVAVPPPAGDVTTPSCASGSSSMARPCCSVDGRAADRARARRRGGRAGAARPRADRLLRRPRAARGDVAGPACRQPGVTTSLAGTAVISSPVRIVPPTTTLAQMPRRLSARPTGELTKRIASLP